MGGRLEKGGKPNFLHLDWSGKLAAVHISHLGRQQTKAVLARK